MTWSRLRHETIRRQFVAMVVALGTTLGVARVGWACSCGGTWEPKDADVIFRGQAVDVHQPLYLKTMPRRRSGVAGVAWGVWFLASKSLDEDVRTVFRVEESWRGNPAEYVSLNTGSGLCCNCSLGKWFTEGREYVVYAVRWNGELQVDSCAGRAVEVTPASLAELASLGMGMGKAPTTRSGHVPLFWRHLLLPVALLGPILLATSLLLLRAKRGQGNQTPPGTVEPPRALDR